MKRKVNSTQYNRSLFVILVLSLVVICLIVATACMKSENEIEKTAPEVNGNTQESKQPETEDDKNDAKEPSKSENNDNNGDDIVNNGENIENTSEASEVKADESNDWMLILANPWNSIPEDFTVELAEISGGHKVDARIVDDLNTMMNDLAKEGLSAFVCSSYRTNTKQTTLYNNEVSSYKNRGYSDEEATIEAAKWVAIPGTSEHQTGLAIDIMSLHYMVLDEGQEDTAEQKWLMDNSWKYGFILRYPNNKSEITGIYYEPWHYRYVGKDAAKEIYEKGICFEEYLLY